MAQPPFLVDQIQIEPGSAGDRYIRRVADGSIEFVDAVVTGGITLSQLAGLRSIGNLLVVGKAGAGAEYSTVQAALDAIPATSSLTNPYFVLIGPGVYKETINIVRDGVHLFGFGAILQSQEEDNPNGPGAYHTIVIQAAIGTIPQWVTLNNLRIMNVHDNFAVIRIQGGAGSQVGEEAIRLVDCHLIAYAAAGNRPLQGNTVNRVVMQGGSMTGSDALSLLLMEDCAELTLSGVLDVPNLQFDYDTGNPLPNLAGSICRLSGCSQLGWGTLAPQIQCDLIGAGHLDIIGCTGVPNITVSGDQTVAVRGSGVGDVNISGSTSLSLSGSQKGSTVISGGTATMEEETQRGTVAFAAALSVSVTFQTPQPDALYTVGIETDARPTNDEVPWITNKTAAGFDVNFNTNQTLGVTWTVHRVLGGAVN
jgi:hypothetical protein